MARRMAAVWAEPRRPLWREVWRHRWEYLFISPFFILFGIFSLYPLLWALVLSFSRWSGFDEMRWVGLDNYLTMLRDEVVRKALFNTLLFTLVLVPSGVLLALIFAVLLNIRDLKGRGVYRTLYFLPFITSTVIIGIVFRMVFDDTFGWVNGLLQGLGLPPVPWFRSQVWAKVVIILLAHWHGLGYNVLIMLGGLQSIDREIYEAAAIDGAGRWAQFWQVTLPLMRPVMLFVAILGTIGVLNMFTEPYILTQGGPENSTRTLTLRQYDLAFAFTRYGDGAALGFLISLLVISVSLIQWRLLREWRQ